MRGLGMNLAQSEDVRKQGLGTIKARTQSSIDELQRTAGRTKQNTTADLVRRGVLRSGEANTRYARQDEDVAARRSDIEQARTEATQAVEQAYEGARGTYRQAALERTLGAETEQAQQKATSAAQEESFKRQEEASTKAYQQQTAAQEAYLTKMEELYKQYGQQGVAL
jgi:hypothetical protein